MDFTIEEYNEEVHLTIIEETDTLEFSIEETVEELNLTIEEYHGADGVKGEKGDKGDKGDKGEKGDYGGGLMSVVAGENITIDNSDPLNPIINAEDGGTTVTKTSDLQNDGEDGVHPFITAEDIPAQTPQVNADWNATEGVAEILNKPEIPEPLPEGNPGDVLVKGAEDWEASSRLTNVEAATDMLMDELSEEIADRTTADNLLQFQIDSEEGRNNTQDAQIADLYVSQAKFTVTSSITNETLSTVSNLKQHNRNNLIANGVNAINITLTATAEAKFLATYHKLGSGTITFVAGAGVNLVLIDGIAAMTGTAELQTAAVHRDGNKYYIQISNR